MLTYAFPSLTFFLLPHSVSLLSFFLAFSVLIVSARRAHPHTPLLLVIPSSPNYHLSRSSLARSLVSVYIRNPTCCTTLIS